MKWPEMATEPRSEVDVQFVNSTTSNRNLFLFDANAFQCTILKSDDYCLDSKSSANDAIATVVAALA